MNKMIFVEKRENEDNATYCSLGLWSAKLGRNSDKFYDESALTCDIYNELRAF